jgi:hypothetical protein
MTQQRSREALVSFLDYLGKKGLMAPATASARKAAVNTVLGILDESEAADVSTLDLDGVMDRFSNLQGKSFTPGSMKTYKSRVRAAIDDFVAYIENPMAFKPKLKPRVANGGVTKKSSTAIQTTQPGIVESDNVRPTVTAFTTVSILPIPIRADLTIQVQGLPFDLTSAEANKIANVILAMAGSN